ncbi:hypothetical protein DFH09DRAFT_1322199 [Mycena vulgaris]|nr:hypothetical protein DFH09DRAFT_1322199 [Mycena vulgaris]
MTKSNCLNAYDHAGRTRERLCAFSTPSTLNPQSYRVFTTRNGVKDNTASTKPPRTATPPHTHISCAAPRNGNRAQRETRLALASPRAHRLRARMGWIVSMEKAERIARALEDLTAALAHAHRQTRSSSPVTSRTRARGYLHPRRRRIRGLRMPCAWVGCSRPGSSRWYIRPPATPPSAHHDAPLRRSAPYLHRLYPAFNAVRPIGDRWRRAIGVGEKHPEWRDGPARNSMRPRFNRFAGRTPLLDVDAVGPSLHRRIVYSKLWSHADTTSSSTRCALHTPPSIPLTWHSFARNPAPAPHRIAPASVNDMGALASYIPLSARHPNAPQRGEQRGRRWVEITAARSGHGGGTEGWRGGAPLPSLALSLRIHPGRQPTPRARLSPALAGLSLYPCFSFLGVLLISLPEYFPNGDNAPTPPPSPPRTRKFLPLVWKIAGRADDGHTICAGLAPRCRPKNRVWCTYVVWTPVEMNVSIYANLGFRFPLFLTFRVLPPE